MFNMLQFIFNNVLFCKKGKESYGGWEEEEKEGHSGFVCLFVFS